MMEPASTGNPDLPLLIALAAIIAGPAVAYVVGRLQERGAHRRFNAEASWRLAKEFRVEYATFSTACFDLSMEVVRLQISGHEIWKSDRKKFGAVLTKVVLSTKDITRMTESLKLFLDSDNEEDMALESAIDNIPTLVTNSLPIDYDSKEFFVQKFDMTEFVTAMKSASLQAQKILRRMQHII